MKGRLGLLIGAVASFAAGCVTRSDVTRAEAHALVARGAILVDVRSPTEFAERHAAGARNIPLEALRQRLGELPDKARPVIVYCHTGIRAAIAADQLKKAGYTQVRNLGTLGHWNKENSDTSF